MEQNESDKDFLNDIEPKKEGNNANVWLTLVLYLAGFAMGIYTGIDIGVDFGKDWSFKTIDTKLYVQLGCIAAWAICMFFNLHLRKGNAPTPSHP